MTESDGIVYNHASVEQDTEGSLRSARLVVPIVLTFVQPQSVVDIGCGRGPWLRAFEENGVRTIQGLDGPWVDPTRLLIDPTRFRTVDLTRLSDIDGRFDLAVCLEVGEHLDATAARPLIRALTATAPCVLFSAAIPGQTGTCHVNERQPAYWKSLFAEQGFRRLDSIRPRVWQDNRIEWWYRQNIFLYVSPDALATSPLLQAEDQRTCDVQLDLIHENYPAFYEELQARYGELEARYGELEVRYGELEVRYGEMEARYAELEARYAELEARYAELVIRHRPFSSVSGILRQLPREAYRAVKRRLF